MIGIVELRIWNCLCVLAGVLGCVVFLLFGVYGCWLVEWKRGGFMDSGFGGVRMLLLFLYLFPLKE